MSDLDYGNARVRSRKAGLLRRVDYEALLGHGLDDVLGLLSTTAYAPEVDHALARFNGLPALHEAVRQREAREVREVRGFFGPEEAGMSLWVSRYDVANLVSVLRGLTRGAAPDEILRLLVPAGTIEDGVLADLARQPSLREALDRLVVWGLPSRRVAIAIARAWSVDTEPAVLELALLRGWAAEISAALDDGVAGPALARVLRDELDSRNLLMALRLHDGAAGVPLAELAAQWLPGGRLRLEAVASAVAAADRAEVVRQLDPLPAAWRGPLDQWAAGTDTVATSDAVHTARFQAIHRLFTGGDPLGIAVPVAYLSALQVEARNLRAIGRGAAHGIPADLVRPRLILLEAA